MSANPKVTKTKTAMLKQEPYKLSDLRLEHDLPRHCGFVELGNSPVSVS